MSLSSALPVSGRDSEQRPRHKDPYIKRFSSSSLLLFAVLILSMGFRLWNLSRNGWGNEYYSAAVLSMSSGWWNFFYASFDPAGFVSVDKPPFALWIQVAFVKIFGFHGLSVLVPQVIEGLAAIWILYHLVHRRFGEPAGLLAALFLAVTPIGVAIDRSSNTDSLLVLVLLLAAWALTIAMEKGSRIRLIAAMAIIGIGFNVKMLAAYVVLPTFALVYLLGAPIVFKRRIADLAIGLAVLLTVSLSWTAFYDLTPKDRRPYAGTSKHNSMFELAIGPYAVGRFVPTAKRLTTNKIAGNNETIEKVESQPITYSRESIKAGIRRAVSRLFLREPVGPLRLADGHLAGQCGWLLPLAVFGAMLGAVRYRIRKPLGPESLGILLWLGWAVTYGIVYSYAGGVIHLYYLSTMAPPLAALAAIGTALLWDRYLQRYWGALLLPAALILTAAWQLHVQADALGWRIWETISPLATIVMSRTKPDNWPAWLHAAVLIGMLVSVSGLLAVLILSVRSRFRTAPAVCVFGIGLAAAQLLPITWALSCVLLPGHGILPSADIARLVSYDYALFQR